MTNRLLLLLHLLATFNLLFVSANAYETDDAIIIEGKRILVLFGTSSFKLGRRKNWRIN